MNFHGSADIDHRRVECSDFGRCGTTAVTGINKLLNDERFCGSVAFRRSACDLERIHTGIDVLHAVPRTFVNLGGEDELSFVAIRRDESLLTGTEVTGDEVVPAHDGVAVDITGLEVLDCVVDFVSLKSSRHGGRVGRVGGRAGEKSSLCAAM